MNFNLPPFSENDAFVEIVKWARDKLSPWQHDVLRHLLNNKGVLAKQNYDNILSIIREGKPVQFLDIDKDIPADINSVCLESIGPLKNINALQDDQVLKFEKGPSLNIVYGENGSGKSSYARVISDICASSSRENNQIDLETTESPLLDSRLQKFSPVSEGHLSYFVDDEKEARSFSWRWAISNIYDRHIVERNFYR